jgi:hypothetical protein
MILNSLAFQKEICSIGNFFFMEIKELLRKKREVKKQKLKYIQVNI